MGIHEYLCRDKDEISGKFLMLPPELFEEKAFQSLTHAARTFYIVCAVHKESDVQRSCLKKALEDYNTLHGYGWTKNDILGMAMPNKRTKPFSRDKKCSRNYFCIPQKHLKCYGYRPAYTTKLKNELMQKGFIRIAFGGKGKWNGWNENVTVYEFSTAWKTQEK